MSAADLTYADYVWQPDGSGFRQRDLTPRAYDASYLDVYREREVNCQRLAALRLGVLEAFTGVRRSSLLDFGCGTNHFARLAARDGWAAYGHDVVNGDEGPRVTWDDALALTWNVVTFFDSLEHLPHPAGTIQALRPETLMISLPECHYPDCEPWFMPWRHRRPHEHLWHWNRRSLDVFLSNLGYKLLALSTFEDTIRVPYHPVMNNTLTVIYQRRGS